MRKEYEITQREMKNRQIDLIRKTEDICRKLMLDVEGEILNCIAAGIPAEAFVVSGPNQIFNEKDMSMSFEMKWWFSSSFTERDWQRH